MFWRKKKKDTPVQTILQPHGNFLPDLDIVIKTDIGNIRTNNEDASVFVRLNDENIIRDKGVLLIVADGMGGHNAGEVASNMATDIVSEEYFKPETNAGFEKNLAKAFTIANKRILHLSNSDKSYNGMGTTCTAIVVSGNHIYYAHCGDTRAYIYKNKILSQITEDHTYVQTLVNSGAITAAEADTHPERNILINAMGTKPSLRVDTGKYQETFDVYDRILICSDGMHDYFSEVEIAQLLNHNKSLDEAAACMIDEAKRRGGKDNITVALAERKTNLVNPNLKITRDSGLETIV